MKLARAVLAFAVPVLLGTTGARAEQPEGDRRGTEEPERASGETPLLLRATPSHTRFSLAVDPHAPPVATCIGRCEITGGRGRYLLRIEPTGDNVGGETKFELEGPSLVTIEPRTRTHQLHGELMAFSGILMLIAGTIGLLHAENSRCTETKSSTGEWGACQATLWLSLGGLGVGAVFVPVGLVKAARTSPSLTIVPLSR